MRNTAAARTTSDIANQEIVRRAPGISPELSEVLEMLNSLEDKFSALTKSS